MAALIAAILSLGGCGDGRACGMEILLDAPIVDECSPACGRVIGPRGTDFVLASDTHGPLLTGRTDSRGEASFCIDRLLYPGEYQLTTYAPEGRCDEDGGTALTVKPFGYDWGLDKPIEALSTLPWVPEITGLDDPPVLEPDPEGWDSAVVSMPGLASYRGRRLLYYAGRGPGEGYGIGVAEQQADGSFLRLDDSSLFSAERLGTPEGAWNYAAQNTPEAVVIDGELWLYYNGDLGDGRLAIGAGISDDGLHFTQHPGNPLLTAEALVRAEDRGSSVAHTSIVEREEGVYEMWFATGTLWIGYALSTDGVDWTPYCELPVMEGDGGWDQGTIKAPEVVYEDDLYWMTYTGCDKGCYQVGWAASADGIRWVRLDQPLLPARGGETWNAVATQGAEIEVEGDLWRFWYAGSDGALTAIGRAEARRPPLAERGGTR